MLKNILKKQLVMLATGILLGGLALSARAEISAPDTDIKNAVDAVLIVLKQDQSDKKKVQTVVDSKVLPLFDFTLMTKRAVGPTWKTATAEQKKTLVNEFRDLLVRVFIAKAFTENTNRTVKFEPIKVSEEDDQITVKSLIVGQGKSPIEVDYDMKKTAAGWKVVDLAIAGPRLALDIYSVQFRDPLQQDGIDGLIKFLGDKNRAIDTGAPVSHK